MTLDIQAPNAYCDSGDDDSEFTEDGEMGAKLMYGYGPGPKTPKAIGSKTLALQVSPFQSPRRTVSRAYSDFSPHDGEEESHSVQSIRSNRSHRRASMKGGGVANMLSNGYGSDEGESDDDERGRYSRARSMRRASLKAGRRASAGFGRAEMLPTVSGHKVGRRGSAGYGQTELPVRAASPPRRGARRASMSGPVSINSLVAPDLSRSSSDLFAHETMVTASGHSKRRARRSSISGPMAVDGPPRPDFLVPNSTHSKQRVRRASLSGGMGDDDGPIPGDILVRTSSHSSTKQRVRQSSLHRDNGPETTHTSTKQRVRQTSLEGGNGHETTHASTKQRVRQTSLEGGNGPETTYVGEYPAQYPVPEGYGGQARRGSAAGMHQPAPFQSPTGRGINPEALARMNRRMSAGLSQGMDEDDSQKRNDGDPYGYGYGACEYHNPIARHARRPSTSSQASRSSTRSRRRNSCVIRKDADPLMMLEIEKNSRHLVPDSDLEDSDDDNAPAASLYGYGAPPRTLQHDYDSDANGSQRSNRSRRRNSCLIRKEADPFILAELVNGPPRVSECDLDDSDSENPTRYGYGFNAPQVEMAANTHSYDSDAHASRVSQRSKRPNSFAVRNEPTTTAIVDNKSRIPTEKDVVAPPLDKAGDPVVTDDLLGPPRTSDIEYTDDSTEATPNSNRFGYGFGLPRLANTSLSFDKEDDSSERSEDASVMSTKRSRRRNSCIDSPDLDPLAASLLGHAGTGVKKVFTDLEDPDSLLSRSGFFSTNIKPKVKTAKAKPTEALGKDTVENDNDDDEELFKKPVIAEQLTPPRLGRDQIATPTVIPPPTTNNTKEASPENDVGWSRSTPFTTSYTGPTEDLLKGKKNSSHSRGALKQSMHCNWGEMDIASDPSSSNSSEDSFGASMYTDSKGFQEIDRYKQRARRRSSIDAGCIDMKEVLDSPVKDRQKMKFKVPDFKPADGCTNASDFVVRCFSARLRLGITVLKHNRSRWSKSQLRVLYLLPDGKTLSWKPVEGEKDKGKRPKLDLTMCREVRHAWTPESATSKKQGTSILRKNCKEGMAAKSLALVFPKRTFDMTAMSLDLCKVLLEGFSALCFRLQLNRTEDPDDGSVKSGCNDAGDDWASTVYGPESTVSVSITNTQSSAPFSPWGL